MRTLIYLDESGDLGWSFDKPYGKGGSSRMLTLAAVCIPENKGVLLQRIVKTLYIKRKRPLKNELKSIDLNMADKELFMRLTRKMLLENPDINLRSITANKENILKKYHSDPNRFYHYIVKLLLLKKICQSEYVDFMPDRRNERVSTRWGLAEYIKQMVFDASFEHEIKNVSCNICPMDSSKSLELQFIDFYAGMVWSKYEFEHKYLGDFMSTRGVSNYKLFFPEEDKEQKIQDNLD